MSEADAPSSDSAPVFKVLTPNATPEEIAAVVAVLAASSASAAAPAPKPVRAWSANVRKLRAPVRHGRGGWRAHGLPH